MSAPAAAVPLFAAPEDQQAVTPWASRLPCRFEPPERWPSRTGALGDTAFWLAWQGGRLQLARGAERRAQWVPVPEVHRRAVRSTGLARACGLGRKSRPGAAGLRVLDGTAGWGVDGLSLALLGAQVTLLEQHAAIWALCDDLCRALGAQGSAGDRAVVPSAPIATAQFGSFADWLEARPGLPDGPVDVVYLDPMFPPRSKQAAPGKRLQYLSALLQDQPAPAAAVLGQWVVAARERASDRVVVKRRRLDAAGDPAPDWQIVSRSVRYDVYAAR